MSSARRNLMLGTAGHVDHGKTALVKLLTGCETDTMAEEKQRGLTIDLGFAPCRLSDQRVVGIVDVPGHTDFIRNMVAGAHGLDVVIFVVAADDGIMPQTQEHLHILTFMGVRHGLVALTKIDLVDPPRLTAVTEELRELLAGTFLAEAPICPVSNVTGAGFERFFESLNQVVAECGDRPCTGWFRMWVADAFTIRGAGTVVTGIPSNGRVRIADPLHLAIANQRGHVRRLQVYGEDADEGRSGECVALNLPEFDARLLRRGMLLAQGDALPPVSMAEAELQLLPELAGPLEDYVEVQLHLGTAAVAAHVAMLESARMTAGQRQMVQLRLTESLPLVPGERFVIRGPAPRQEHPGIITLGGGRILGTSNVRLRRRRPWTLELLSARAQSIEDPLRWCETMVREHSAPVSPQQLQTLCWLTPPELATLTAQLQSSGCLVQTRTGGWLHRDVVEPAARALSTSIRTFHARNPERVGLAHDAATPGTDAELHELAVARLLASGEIERHGDLICARGWRPQVASHAQQLSDQIEGLLKQAAWTPPSVAELATRLGAALARVATTLQLLAERRVVARLGEDLWMHQQAIEAAQTVALRLFRQKPSFSTMEFRDALGVSRKYAVPLLDHLDRIRFTVRSGHDRTPGVEARRRLES